jgi:uncharacterized protein (DUF2141 family)
MKKWILMCALAVACGSPEEGGVELEKGDGVLRVEVAGIRSSDGMVSCALFNAAEGFPGRSPIRDGTRKFSANGGTVLCECLELPAGEYAVSALHDENGNGTVDTNFVGAPTEGTGATNNATQQLGPPGGDSKIALGAGASIETRVDLVYRRVAFRGSTT